MTDGARPDSAAEFRGTTVLGILGEGAAALGGDGQVTLGNTIMKGEAQKVRRLHDGNVLVGFAGSAADGLALLERFEGKLKQHGGKLPRAAVELAKEWRTDRFLRRLEALLAAVDRETALIVSGTGEVVEPDDGIVAIGSGGPFALSAARALRAHTELSPREIVERSLRIAAGVCIYTNDHITVEEL
jgi:ATP-dependent HslUV protease subunit HslV